MLDRARTGEKDEDGLAMLEAMGYALGSAPSGSIGVIFEGYNPMAKKARTNG